MCCACVHVCMCVRVSVCVCAWVGVCVCLTWNSPLALGNLFTPSLSTPTVTPNTVERDRAVTTKKMRRQ